jgi:hypothetical protein
MYLYFVIRGNWSGTWNDADIPLIDRKKLFLPDAVTVRIDRDPSRSSISDEQRKDDEAFDKAKSDQLVDKREIGGVTCGRHDVPVHGEYKGGFLCWGHRAPPDYDALTFRTFPDTRTPFIWIDAQHESRRYGGINVHWQVWTLDIARAHDIDQAIWDSLTEWNLVSEPLATAVQP